MDVGRLKSLSPGMDCVMWRGWMYTAFILNFVFACQFLLLQPLVSADGGKSINTSELLERAFQSMKVKRYNKERDDLNAAIQAHPDLSEAHIQKASTLQKLGRFFI